MKKKVKAALVLAAGYGTRMLPNTRAYPKELMSFGEKPIIERVIETLKDAEIKRIAIVVGWRKGAIMDFLGNGCHWNTNIFYIQQESMGGLGNAILMGKSFFNRLESEDFVVFFGDNFIRPSSNLKTLIQIHETRQPLASILVFETTNPERYGVVKIKKVGDYYQVLDMFEKPETPEEKKPYEHNGKYLAISCAYVFNQKIFSYIEETQPGKGGEIQITDAVKLALQHGEEVYVHILDGEFIDVGGWDYLRKVRSYFCSLSDEQLDKIIEERKQLMEKLRIEK